MSVSTVPILPPSAPPRPLAGEWWLIVLEEHFEQVRREYLIELASTHPGSRHRLAQLRAVAERLHGQIQAAIAARDGAHP